MNRLHNRMNYKWVIVGICFLMVFTGLGFASSTKSLYITAITETLGISRGLFSINDSLRYIATAIVNVFFGSLIARFGSKKLIIAGFGFLILSCVVYAVATHILMFYLGGIFLGIGLSWTTTTMVSSVINKWCKENKGAIMGAALAANGIGGAVATQIVTPIIYKEGDSFGFRKAYFLTAIIFIAVLVVILVLYKEKQGTEEQKVKKETDLAEDDGFKEILKNKYFYILVICIFLTGMVIQGITGISTPHLQDVGLDIGFISAILSLHWIVLTLTKFLTGFIYDRAGLKVSMNICMVAALIVMFTLPLVTNSLGGKILATVYEIVAPMALPLETIMLPIYAGDLFGQKSFDKVLGVFVSVNTAGYAVGTPIANLCFDIFGSYKVALIGAGIIMALVVIVMQIAVKRVKK